MPKWNRWLMASGMLLWLSCGMAWAQAGAETGATQPAEPAAPPGFTGAESEDVTFSKADSKDERYWVVIRKLTEAIHNEDEAAFQALFSKRLWAREGSSLESSLSFMSQVMGIRGTIKKFHKLSEQAMDFGDSDYPVRSVMFHMQDGVPGYFALALDGDDMLDHFSLFIKRDLCSGGKRCELAVIELEEEPVN